MVNVSFRARITNIAALQAIAKATIKDRLVATVPRARAVYASRGVLLDRFFAMANASLREPIICIAVLLTIAEISIKAPFARWAHRASRVPANRDALPVKYSVTANASPREPITYIVVHPAIVRATTEDRPAARVHRANRAPASRDVLPGRFCVMANV